MFKVTQNLIHISRGFPRLALMLNTINKNWPRLQNSMERISSDRGTSQADINAASSVPSRKLSPKLRSVTQAVESVKADRVFTRILA